MKKTKLAIVMVSLFAVAAIAVGIVLMIDPAGTEQQAEPSTVTDPSTAPVEPSADTVYVSNQCLYMNPLSSYGAFGGDSGYRYHMLEDSFIIENRDEGLTMATGYEVMEGSYTVFENIGWDWIPYHEVSKELDKVFENSMLFSIPVAQDALYQRLSNNYFLLQQGGELLLFQTWSPQKIGTQLFSIYSLVPESDMGSAQWEFDPASSANLPLFRFDFDMDCTDINAVCTQSSVSTYDELKDTYLTPEMKDGNTIYWSPVNEYGEIVTVADIGIIPTNGDMPLANGRIYITGEPSGDLGEYLYTATIVGTGLHMEQAADGTGAVITFVSDQVQASAMSDPVPGTTYIPNQYLYMNPLLTSTGRGDDTQCRYHVSEDSFSVEPSPVYSNGDTLEPISNISWNWEPLPYSEQEIMDLCADGSYESITEIFKDTLYQPISDSMFLLQKDGQLLLVRLMENSISSKTEIWTIYSLVPDN